MPILKPKQIDRVTVGITSFDRPEHLQQLVASIAQFYPKSRVLVADNGNQRPDLPDWVEVIELPYDVGLSAARNALIDRLDREFLFLLEDDFELTDETRLEPWLDVLDHDPEVGFVGGSLYQEGRRHEYACDLHRFRSVLHVEPARRELRMTSGGTAYRYCDLCFNFGLIRREMLADHRWPDELKLGEHAVYFERVQQAGLWRVAHCDAVRAIHHRNGRSPEYVRQRGRAASILRGEMARQGLTRVRVNPQLALGTPPQRTPDKPNIVILGVGHSGTSILAKMLFAAGWESVDADEEFGESVSVREINQTFIKTGQFSHAAALRSLFQPGPWAIKDPRFSLTLPQWLHSFAQLEQPPTLIWIRRNQDDTVASYVRRGVLTQQRARQVVTHRCASAERHFAQYPWAKLAIDYEQLRQAVALFDVQRSPSTAAAAAINDIIAAAPEK